jgi:hypothetical protein
MSRKAVTRLFQTLTLSLIIGIRVAAGELALADKVAHLNVGTEVSLQRLYGPSI